MEVRFASKSLAVLEIKDWCCRYDFFCTHILMSALLTAILTYLQFTVLSLLLFQTIWLHIYVSQIKFLFYCLQYFSPSGAFLAAAKNTSNIFKILIFFMIFQKNPKSHEFIETFPLLYWVEVRSVHILRCPDTFSSWDILCMFYMVWYH